MKTQLFKSALAATVLFGAIGCGGPAANPLVGTWRASLSASGIDGNSTLTLNANGTASLSAIFTGGMAGGMTVTCTGPGLTYSGLTWTSTATTLSITGTPMCSGMISCMVGGMSQDFGCSTAGMNMTEGLSSAMYTLTNNNNTLTITTTSMGMSSMQSFSRQM